jgi:hypothetical protein
MSGKPAQAKKTKGEVQTTEEQLAKNVELLVKALSDGITPYDEAIEQGYAPVHEIAKLFGISPECARKRVANLAVDTVKSKVPGKRQPENFYRVQAAKE